MSRRRPTDLIFQLEHQFTLYLQRGGVTRSDLGVDQYREMRRAFYGGLGQMFFLITQDIGTLKEREQVTTLELFQRQIGKFWNDEVANHDAGRDELHPSMPVKCDCGWCGKVDELEVPPNKGSGRTKVSTVQEREPLL